MRGKGGLRRLRAMAFVLLAAVLLCAAPAALAIDPIDTGRETSLTIRYPVKGVSFTIYRVGEMTGFGEFTPTRDFAGACTADQMNGLDAEGWSELAGTLSGYAGASGQWKRTARIGRDGTAEFTGLSVGLYLVLGTPYRSGGRVYLAQPTLVALPSRDAHDVWIYDVCIEPKPEVVDTYDEIRVQKVWMDNHSSSRPTEITVRLYVNGRLYDTVKLNAANNWRYTWRLHNVAQPAVFRVTEYPVPTGYTHSIDYTGTYLTSDNRPGKLITIVNKLRTPGSCKPSGPLPQTGLLWWPVPLLAALGMALFVIGWLRRRRHEEE